MTKVWAFSESRGPLVIATIGWRENACRKLQPGGREILVSTLCPKTGQSTEAVFGDGMLWIARTGAPWWILPERYGALSTVASRFCYWHRAGIWQRILEALLDRAGRRGQVDVACVVDSTAGARMASRENGGIFPVNVEIVPAETWVAVALNEGCAAQTQRIG
ncbi:transposase [Azospirillum canadense]|uniref:transposase n=1 Tax=Azospirillum canadense TaxID=403962 RepID=UPI002225C3F2|nr:transposase [Azospirillum canadense]MCW2238177.1 transposase [Azospirillum canadense]